jgi:hypothetical protein
VADGLVQISDELRNLRYGAPDHDPECEIYFQRYPHRASPRLVFDFCGNAHSDNSSGGRFGPIQGFALHAFHHCGAFLSKLVEKPPLG